MLQVLQIVTAATVALGYFVVAGFVVPQIGLGESSPRFALAVRIGAIAFFVGCGLTHTHILVHAVEGGAGRDPEVHEVVFHFLQVGGVWVFALAAMRVLDVSITRRKTEDERLREQLDELARSNDELEQFAHVVSHDLQEPLRTMSGFARLLERRLGTVPTDPVAAEAVTQLRSESERMSVMLARVLELSRAAGVEMIREEVDLADVLAGVRRSLAGRIAESGASVSVDGVLPTVWGDAVQLGQVLQNLVANALKFARDDVPPAVTVRAQETLTGWEISVQDNGVGIPVEHRDAIFKLFERAPSTREGTGVGLAVCAKVVERHGGRLWVDEAPGGGSIFRFTLAERAAVPALLEA